MKNKKYWLRDGSIGLIVGVIINVILAFIYSNNMGSLDPGYAPRPVIVDWIILILIWPALVMPNVLGIVIAVLYYIVLGLMIGLIYRKIRNK